MRLEIVSKDESREVLQVESVYGYVGKDVRDLPVQIFEFEKDHGWFGWRAWRKPA
jgi:hypothetical protein